MADSCRTARKYWEADGTGPVRRRTQADRGMCFELPRAGSSSPETQPDNWVRVTGDACWQNGNSVDSSLAPPRSGGQSVV